MPTNKEKESNKSNHGFELFSTSTMITTMRDKNITTTELAALMGVSVAAVSRWVNHERRPGTLDMVRRIAEALNVPVHYLLKDL